jgi:hypothetical protein
MQAGAAESPLFMMLRWFVALAFTLLGCLLYATAPLAGIGVHLGPEPGLGMLIAGIAVAGAVGGYCAVRSEKKASSLATIINFVLIVGALQLVGGVVRWGFETFYRVPSSEAGHSEPGAVLFMASYGALSVLSLVVFNKWVTPKNTVSQE